MRILVVDEVEEFGVHNADEDRAVLHHLVSVTGGDNFIKFA